MIKPNLKKGDRLLIRSGNAHARYRNPPGKVVAIFTSQHDLSSRFYATCPESDRSEIEYWYNYDEIVKVLSAKPRKGRLIGGYAVQ